MIALAIFARVIGTQIPVVAVCVPAAGIAAIQAAQLVLIATAKLTNASLTGACEAGVIAGAIRGALALLRGIAAAGGAHLAR